MTPFLEPKIIHQFQYLPYQEVLEFLQQNNALDELWVAIDDIPEHYEEVCVAIKHLNLRIVTAVRRIAFSKMQD